MRNYEHKIEKLKLFLNHYIDKYGGSFSHSITNNKFDDLSIKQEKVAAINNDDLLLIEITSLMLNFTQEERKNIYNNRKIFS